MALTVTIDDEPLAAKHLGMETLGHVLSHIQRDKKLVVQILIDGNEPPLAEMGALRNTKLEGHCVYIETADPLRLVDSVLTEVQRQLNEADEARIQCAGLLRQNQTQKAMERLGFCFRSWQDVQESVAKVVELIRLDLNQAIDDDGAPLAGRFDHFSSQLRRIKESLQRKDFISLGDLLGHDMAQSADHWKSAIRAIRNAVSTTR